MAATVQVERRGIPKRRSWRKQGPRDKHISIDHMDLSVLTRIDENESTCPSITDEVDLQHPELMSNLTLIAHLSRMKVAIPDGQSGRNKLLNLFQKYVRPKPQRRVFWRRRRRRPTGEPMEVENTYSTGTDHSSSWDSPVSRKRYKSVCIKILLEYGGLCLCYYTI